MNLFGTVNSKLFDCENDDFLIEKRSHIFVSDRVSVPVELHFINIS